MRILFLFLLSVFLQVTAYSQSSERPEGIVLPVATLGDVTETRRQILQNTLIESLSSYYRLVPQDKLEEVQEKIFQEMDYDECTEDQCIVMIQEALQVENLFVLQVIGEGDDTQLSLKWVGLDDKKVKTDVCKGCGTFELNERVEGLVKKLTVSEEIITTPTVEKEKVEPKKESNQDSKYSFFVLINTPLSSGELDLGGFHIPHKGNSGFSFGGKFGDHIFLYKSLQIEFDLKDHSGGSDRELNYKTETQFISYSYKINTFTFGYNHLLNGKVTEDSKEVRTSNNKTFEYNITTDIDGYGISIGYIYDINEFFIWTLFERYQLKNTSSEIQYDAGYFIFQGLSIGGGMQF